MIKDAPGKSPRTPLYKGGSTICGQALSEPPALLGVGLWKIDIFRMLGSFRARGDKDLLRKVHRPGRVLLSPYCIGEKADGIMILFAMVSRRPAPPPGGHTPACRAEARTLSR